MVEGPEDKDTFELSVQINSLSMATFQHTASVIDAEFSQCSRRAELIDDFSFFLMSREAAFFSSAKVD